MFLLKKSRNNYVANKINILIVNSKPPKIKIKNENPIKQYIFKQLAKIRFNIYTKIIITSDKINNEKRFLFKKIRQSNEINTK